MLNTVKKLSLLLWLLLSPAWISMAEDTSIEGIFNYQDIPDLPVVVDGGFLGTSGDALILAGGEVNGRPNTDVFVLIEGSDAWQKAGTWETPQSYGGASSDGTLLICAGGEINGELTNKVTQIEWMNNEVAVVDLMELPEPLFRPAVLLEKDNLWVAGGSDNENLFIRTTLTQGDWEKLDAFPGKPRQGALFLKSFDSRYYLIGGMSDSQANPQTLEYSSKDNWVSKNDIPFWKANASGVSFGESHVMVFGATDDSAILAFHTITNRWMEIGQWADAPDGEVLVTIKGDDILAVAGADGRKIQVSPLKTKYGWIDHTVVVFYLMGMVGIGFYFSNKEKDTKDYFQGGNKIPWWATGMSLFATMASAISLMTMPGKSYSNDWTWFMVSVFSAMTLPISLFILAPLIRKLNIRTSNEYLEYRFGTVTRVMGSLIFVLFQLLGRMAPVMLLPSIALNAITGIDIEVCILVMATVTIAYTFMGGLSAVIWTDTIQGFIMVGTIGACLIMAIIQLDMPVGEIFSTASEAGKLHMVDWDWDATYPTVWLFFIGTIFIAFNQIGDQNFIQRVQCTANLRETRKAVALQMAVAVPINFLLFALGTALFLYYQNQPEQLNPSMRADGVYPFFAAQKLPIGISGLVVAALLAATMSTISSSICSVANLGVDDFYRRFSKDKSEKSALFVGRGLTLAVGIIGTGAALFLANAEMPSIWDLALFLTNLVSNGVTGLFALGLVTKRANQTGAIVGVITGMIVVFMVQELTPINLWLYMAIGSVVTFIVGYTVSLLIPCKPRSLDGLTIYTMDKPRVNS
jgi:solute:Na+ symporter, SSS family